MIDFFQPKLAQLGCYFLLLFPKRRKVATPQLLLKRPDVLFDQIDPFQRILQIFQTVFGNKFQKLRDFGLIKFLLNSFHIDDFSQISDLHQLGRQNGGLSLIVEVEVIRI